MLKLQDTQELHWNGVDGSCRNLEKYGLLLSKPVFSFSFDKLLYVKSGPASKVLDKQVFGSLKFGGTSTTELLQLTLQAISKPTQKMTVSLSFVAMATNINFGFGQLFPVRPK